MLSLISPDSKKKIVWTCFVSFALLWSVLYPFPGPAAGAGRPEMVLAEKVFQAKEVKEDEMIEHTFKVHNKGNGPLEIERVKPG
jgi:hypothetical protein